MRIPLVLALLALAVLFAGAQAYTYTETHFVGEPWSGWWWPEYDQGPSGGPYLWQGPNIPPGGEPGPIYDLDTRYYWRQGPARTLAQDWEYGTHRTTDPAHSSWGHCRAVSCAQALEDDPPSDCGALSQDDLEGLLSELYADCAYMDVIPDIRPSDMWWLLQQHLVPGVQYWGAIVVDFSTAVDVYSHAIGWNWPVYGYKVEYDMPRPDYAKGRMTLYYEEHLLNTANAHDSAKYAFSCKMDGVHTPRRWTGSWDTLLRVPSDPPTPPDEGYKPTERETYVWGGQSNYYLWYYDTTDIRRVIDHTTIIMDDEYMFDADPYPPPDTPWVQRPGFSGSCWAVRGVQHQPSFHMSWRPRLGRSGFWRFKVYKTPPAGGDTLNEHVILAGITASFDTFYNQAVGPFDTWQQVVRDTVLAAGTFNGVHVLSYEATPLPCLTYMDAFRAEWLGYAGDGGAGSSTVALGDETQGVQVVPNPVGRTARISYMVPNYGGVDVVVYDVAGRAVLRAAQGGQRAGVQTATISVAGLPTGTYMARVSAAGVSATCRFVVCR